MMTCQDASFDLFSRPPTDHSIQDVHDQEILPVTAVTGSATTVEFNISGESSEYIDLAETRLYVEVKIEQSNGSELADDTVSLVKYWPHALFSQCDMSLNGTLVTASSGLYNYLAYLSSILSFPVQVKEYQLKTLEHANGWSVKKTAPRSEALIRLHLPLCNQQRFLPNGVNVGLRFLRTSDDFVVIKTTADVRTYAIKLQKVSLFVRRVTPSPSVLLDHASLMSRTNCLYPITRIWPKSFTLQSGVREFDLANVCQGQLPNRIVIGFVKTTAFSGSSTTDPFEFKHFKVDHISLQCNGRSVPAVPITADFESDVFRRAYHTLVDTIQGPCADSDSIGISATDYKDKYCFLGFTLSRALVGQVGALAPRESGYVNAKIRFKEALAENVNAIFFLEFQNFVELDSARNVHLDYAA